MEFFVASDLNHLANNILDLAPKVLYLSDLLKIVNSISKFGIKAKWDIGLIFHQEFIF